MRAGDPVKRFGRADKARQLAGRADAPRELFFSRRSFCAISRRYSLAEPQLQRRDEYEHKANCAWRPLVSMHSSTGWSREAAGRPGALPNPRRDRAQKTGGPTPGKGVRCVRPSDGLRLRLATGRTASVRRVIAVDRMRGLAMELGFGQPAVPVPQPVGSSQPYQPIVLP